jgi:hypothetical protein
MWNRQYWDIVRNFYWTLANVGLQALSVEEYRNQDGSVTIPRELVGKRKHLYLREFKEADTLEWMSSQEEILNQFFNIAFAIAADQVIQRVLLRPLGIVDSGPFESLGREVRSRYGTGLNQRFTQHDGLFLSKSSAVAVELKLDSYSSPQQILKYAALLGLEEQKSGLRKNLGLLFIIPEGALKSHWGKVGLTKAEIDRTYIADMDPLSLSKTTKSIVDRDYSTISDVLDRMRLAAISWSSIKAEVAEIEKSLNNESAGDQTLLRLLSGFQAQLEVHKLTGIA